jgi:chloramphenicol-sensitive protein RarD
MTSITPANHAVNNRSGYINAVSAYVMWGFAPIFFKLLSDISPGEILIQRILWSSIFLLLLVVAMRKSSQLISICKQPKIIGKLMISASLLAVNWFLFIWAVNNDHLLDASLGYYINPLFNVLLGVIFFHERLRRNQLIAVGLALSGVLIQLITLGTLPIISLALASSFAFYGLIRKKMQIDSFIGLLIESLLMLPIAIVCWMFFVESSTSNMANNSVNLNIMIVLIGVVTTAPLLCFTAAAKRLNLSTLGFFQYMGPSIMFLLATFYYQEQIKTAELMTFVFIWAALALYSLDSWKTMKRAKSTEKTQ